MHQINLVKGGDTFLLSETGALSTLCNTSWQAIFGQSGHSEGPVTLVSRRRRFGKQKRGLSHKFMISDKE